MHYHLTVIITFTITVQHLVINITVGNGGEATVENVSHRACRFVGRITNYGDGARMVCKLTCYTCDQINYIQNSNTGNKSESLCQVVGDWWVRVNYRGTHTITLRFLLLMILSQSTYWGRQRKLFGFDDDKWVWFVCWRSPLAETALLGESERGKSNSGEREEIVLIRAKGEREQI
jgi:hypothetical protein